MYGFAGDCSETVFVGSVHPDVQELVNTTREAMNRGIAACRIDGPYSDIGSAIEDYVTSKGFEVAKLFCGHGIGRKFHDSPFIFHHRTEPPSTRAPPPQLLSALPRKRVQQRSSDRNIPGMKDTYRCIKAGHAFTIEPIVCAGSAGAVELNDGWTHVTSDGSISAQFEHTILMTTTGPEILTKRSLLGSSGGLI